MAVDEAGLGSGAIREARTRTFRVRVREELEHGAMNQKKLAEATGLSAGWLSSMLNGHAHPSLATCYRIADALGVPLIYLLDEADSER